MSLVTPIHVEAVGLPLGEAFPPRSAAEVAAYDLDDCFQGFWEHALDQDPPSDNHSAAYRWGWANARRDRSGQPDGFDGLRHGHLRTAALSGKGGA